MPVQPLTDLEIRAWEFAKEAHSKAFRKLSGLPYFDEHIQKVFEILKKYDTSPILGSAAILHDTLEDVDWVTYETLKEKFGEEVADLVKELTSDKQKINELGKGPYLLQKMLQMSDGALTIKLCDRLQNLSDMAKAGGQFREKYLKETFFIIKGLNESKRIFNNPQKRLIEQIETFVSNYKKWYKVESKKQLRYMKLFEDFKKNNITEEDIIKCIKSNGGIKVERVQGINIKPKGYLKPLSCDDGKVTVEIDNVNYEVELDDIIEIKHPEQISESIVDNDTQKDIITAQKEENLRERFPEKLRLYTSFGTHDYNLSDVTREPTIIRVTYYTETPKEVGGNVLADGDPSTFSFDIHLIEPDTDDHTKLNVDMAYGDNMVYSFTIEAPNNVNLGYYDGIGSKLDTDTHYGFPKESLSKLVNTFNSFGKKFNLDAEKHFAFMDKFPHTYIHKESAKITPLSHNQLILVVNNNPPRDDFYLKNLLKYLQTRGIEYEVVSDINQMKKLYKEGNVIGVISSGSVNRIKNKNYKLSRTAYKNFRCPFLGICFGFQSMCKTNGCEIKRGKKHIQDHIKLSEYRPCKIFKGVDLDNLKMSFSFNGYPLSCPQNYQIVAKVGDKIAAIADESNEKYGVLFHPEDVEYSHIILDNFIKLCHHGQDEQEKILTGRFEKMSTKFNPAIRL